MTTFDERRQAAPQSVIDDLIAQTTRQAKAIHELTKQNEELIKKMSKMTTPGLEK